MIKKGEVNIMVKIVTKEYKRLIQEYAKAFAFKWMNEHVDDVKRANSENGTPPMMPPRVTREEIEALQRRLGL